MNSEHDIFLFYMGRIKSARNYGLESGTDIIAAVTRCAFLDSELTCGEFIDILKYATDTLHEMRERRKYLYE